MPFLMIFCPNIRTVLLTLLLAGSTALGLHAQNRLFFGGPATAICSDTITVSVYADFIPPLFGVQYSLQWDTTQLQYVGYTAPALSNTPPGVNDMQVDTGLFAYAWVSFGSSVQMDSTLLLSLRFVVKEGTGTASLLFSEFPIDIVATDEMFNSLTVANSITVGAISITLGDPFGVCGVQKTTVLGAFRRPNGAGIEGVTAELVYEFPGLPTKILTQQSDASGIYTFTEAVAEGGSYDLRPVLDKDPMNGVTTYDMILMSRHILNVQPITNPYLLIAADADASNTVTSFDILVLRRMLLGIYTEFPNNTSWRFLDNNQVFSDPGNPFLSVPFEEMLEQIPVTGTVATHDFTGIKIGDINQSAVANSWMAVDDRGAAAPVWLHTTAQQLEKNIATWLHFSLDADAIGCQFALDMPDVEIMDVRSDASEVPMAFAIHANKSRLLCSWNGSPPLQFDLLVRAKRSAPAEALIGLDPQSPLAAEAYKNSKETQHGPIQLDFARTSDTAPARMTLDLPYPNPFLENTAIPFVLSKGSSVTLEIMDTRGRVVFLATKHFGAGSHIWPIGTKELPQTGIFQFRLLSEHEVHAGRLCKIK